jgi:hypothetical protein
MVKVDHIRIHISYANFTRNMVDIVITTGKFMP